MGNCMDSHYEKTINHQQLGQMQKQYDDKHTIEYFKSTTKLSSVRKYEEWACQIKKMKFNIQIKDFIYIPLKLGVKETDLFNKQTLLQTFYEPYIQTLEDLVKRYQRRKYVPSEEMIWYLIYSLTKVGKYFEKINKKIGNMKLSNILITRSKQLRIICEKSTIDFKSPAQQIQLQVTDRALLAPQEIQHLNRQTNKNPEQRINPQISEVYSAGILALCVANLIQPHTIYKYHKQSSPKLQVDLVEVEKLLANLKENKKFSQLLVKTITQMIQVDPQKRIKSSKLFRRMSEFQCQILSNKGLYYSLHQDEIINSSNNDLLIAQTPVVNQNSNSFNRNGNSFNNSILTYGNRSLNNITGHLSYQVSQISQTEQDKRNFDQKASSYQLNLNNQVDFINIL